MSYIDKLRQDAKDLKSLKATTVSDSISYTKQLIDIYRQLCVEIKATGKKPSNEQRIIRQYSTKLDFLQHFPTTALFPNNCQWYNGGDIAEMFKQWEISGNLQKSTNIYDYTINGKNYECKQYFTKDSIEITTNDSIDFYHFVISPTLTVTLTPKEYVDFVSLHKTVYKNGRPCIEPNATMRKTLIG